MKPRSLTIVLQILVAGCLVQPPGQAPLPSRHGAEGIDLLPVNPPLDPACAYDDPAPPITLPFCLHLAHGSAPQRLASSSRSAAAGVAAAIAGTGVSLLIQSLAWQEVLVLSVAMLD